MLPRKDGLKRTNEIGAFIPLVEEVDIRGKDITADALLCQRRLASHLIGRGAYYHFTVKQNQKLLHDDIELLFRGRKGPDHEETSSGHGRIETRRIWVSSEMEGLTPFPGMAQVFCIEREVVNKKSGKTTVETAYGITSRPSEEASPARLLTVNRGHWTIENRCHYLLDWNYDEDRSRIRTGHGPENVTRLRRFALGVIQLVVKGKVSVAEKIRELGRNVRLVFDYLRMTGNTTRRCRK